MPAAQQGIFVLDGAPYPEDRARLAGMQAAGLYAHDGQMSIKDGEMERRPPPLPEKKAFFTKKSPKTLTDEAFQTTLNTSIRRARAAPVPGAHDQ